MYIERTKKGHPAVWVGGGAFTNTFEATFVLRGNNLAPAVFHRQHGPRCNGSQALVIVQPGDVVVTVSGRRPADPDNPDVRIKGLKVEGFTQDKAIGAEVDVDPDTIPSSVWDGCNIYHNRDGGYFCR